MQWIIQFNNFTRSLPPFVLLHLGVNKIIYGNISIVDVWMLLFLTYTFQPSLSQMKLQR